MHSASSMEEEDRGAWLGLGIGGGGGGGGGGSGGGCAPRRGHGERRPSVQLDVLFPQHVKEERGCDHEQAVNKKGGKGARQRTKIGDDGRSHGASPSDGGNDGSDGGTRKKLQLTKEQSTLLEDSFRVHNILSHAQKQELARQLNLSARQVEVWFQNRRARTKLKQTEVDCEFLKRCCESLTDENQRLKHELMELQRSAAAAAAGSQLYVQFPRSTAMVNFCPSCEKATVISGGEMSNKSSSSCF